jgi:hypothetical protein
MKKVLTAGVCLLALCGAAHAGDPACACSRYAAQHMPVTRKVSKNIARAH